MMMKKLLMLIGLSAYFINTTISKAEDSNSVYAKYISKEYVIDIYYGCLEGEMSCDKITYHGINKKTKEEITLRGKVITRGPYLNFVGYQFKNGNYTYIINERDFDPTILQIFVQNKNKQRLIYQTKLTSIETTGFQYPKYEHFIK